MESVVTVLLKVGWFGLVGFILWVISRFYQSQRLRKENKLLRVLKEVSDEEKRIDNSSLDELVDEFNKRRDSSKKG